MATLQEERILDFLDGRLSSGQEEELLHTLAVSPERRGVLRAHMRVRELTSNLASAECFSVPKHVTSQLFVIHNEHGDLLLRAAQLRASPASAGMDNSTRNWCACGSTRMLASVP